MDEPARVALATWRLEPGMSVGRPTSGVMNETLLITTEERRVVLRRHRRPERRQIELEHRVIAHARHNGIPAPAAIPTPETRSSLIMRVSSTRASRSRRESADQDSTHPAPCLVDGSGPGTHPPCPGRVPRRRQRSDSSRPIQLRLQQRFSRCYAGSSNELSPTSRTSGP